MRAASLDENKGQWRWIIASSVWLVYLAYPIAEFANRSETLTRDIVAGVMLAVYVAVYFWAWSRPQTHQERLVAGAAGLTALSVAAMWGLKLPYALGGLMFVGPLLGFIRSWRIQVFGSVVVLGIMGAAWWLGHDPQSLLWTLGLPFLGLVVAMRIYGDYWHLFHKLRRAEDAVRELAVVNERLKLSRDLHDIVGHSLSVMALRAELAAGQAEESAPEAADEMLHVAQTAREALRDVRGVVSRWRAVSFVDEWGNAERVLASAGITALAVSTLGDLQLPPEVNRLFGFFVREGVTNILRHSRATECRLMVREENLALSIRLEDNGHQDTALAEDGGSGIAGLRERFGELGGSVTAAHEASGYVLEATLPWIESRRIPHAAH